MPTLSLGLRLTSPSGGLSSPVMILIIVLRDRGEKREIQRREGRDRGERREEGRGLRVVYVWMHCQVGS